MGANDGPTGTIQLALVVAPSNLACMRITVTGNITSTQFVSVTPGASTMFTLMGLPTGAVMVKADGFSQVCPAVNMNTNPVWVSNVASATLAPGVAATVNLTMMPNGSATIVTNFPTPPTMTSDTTPPTLISIAPANGATDVAKGSAISGTFSEPIALASLTPSSFSIDDQGLVPPGNYTTLGNAAVFSPSQMLGPYQTYTARLTTGIRDLGGNALMTGTSWTFRTQDGGFKNFGGLVPAGSNVINEHHIAASKTGETFAAWVEFSNSSVTMNVSRLIPGTGWDSPQALQAVDANLLQLVEVTVAADANGGAVVAWGKSDGGLEDLYASRFQPGAGWSAPVLIEPFSGVDFNPSVAIDGAGNAIVAFGHGDAAFTSSTIWATRFVPASGWGTPQQIGGTGSGFAQSPSIAVTPGGDGIVVFDEEIPGQENIWANRFAAATGWGTAQLIEADAGGASSARVAVDAAGDAIAVWHQFDGTFTNVVANHFVPATGWETPRILDADATGSVSETRIGIGVDAAGDAIAVWAQTEGSGTSALERIVADRFVPTTGWGSLQTVAVGGPGQGLLSPDLAVDASGNAIAVWSFVDLGSTPSVRTANASRFTPTLGWASAVTLSSPTVMSVGPLVTVDGFGRGTVNWETAPPTGPFMPQLATDRFE